MMNCIIINKSSPDTFNDDNNVVLIFNLLNPETFKDDIYVVFLLID